MHGGRTGIFTGPDVLDERRTISSKVIALAVHHRERHERNVGAYALRTCRADGEAAWHAPARQRGRTGAMIVIWDPSGELNAASSRAPSDRAGRYGASSLRRVRPFSTRLLVLF